MQASIEAKDRITGIAHIGVGNFHRSHQAYQVHQYLNQHRAANTEWAICRIALLDNDRPVIDALNRQGESIR